MLPAREYAEEHLLVEKVMEPGPSIVRPSLEARQLVVRLGELDLERAIVTTPEGLLVGVFPARRSDAVGAR